MDKEERNIQLIEQYLENKLNPHARAEVEEQLKSDESFNKLMDQTKTLILGIEYSGRNELLRELKAIEGSLPEIEVMEETKVFRIGHHKYLWAVAASIALLIISSIFVINFYLSSSPEKLYEAYYTPYPNVVFPTKRGESESLSDKELAFQAYDLEDYGRAISLFEKIPGNQRNGEVLLYLGNAYLAVENTGQASLNLEKLLNTYSNFHNQAKWYLSLSYLKDGKVEEAKSLLREIDKDNNSYSIKARELLEEME